jgi:hypothetical protein
MRSAGRTWLDAGLVEQFVAHGVVPADQRADQLGQILVAGRDQSFPAAAAWCQGADHVVGFDAIDHQQRPAGSLDRPWSGSIWPTRSSASAGVGLVLGIPVVAKGLALGIEDDGLVLRLVVGSRRRSMFRTP